LLSILCFASETNGRDNVFHDEPGIATKEDVLIVSFHIKGIASEKKRER
jgi:hypothetical protein